MGKKGNKCPHDKEPVAMNVVAATVDTPLKTDSSAKDVAKLTPKQCSQLTTELINATLKGEACAGFRAKCLQAFNATNLNPDCLNSLKKETLKALDGKTVKELVGSDVSHLGISQEAFAEIVDKIEDPPALFIAYVVRNPDLLTVVLNTEKLNTIKPYLKLNTIPKIHPSLFRRLGPKLIASLPDDTFKQATAQQLGLLQTASFGALTAKQIEQIRPEAFKQVTKDQLAALSDEAFGQLSSPQIRALGPTDEVPKVVSKEEEVRALEILERRSYLQSHPCQVLVKRQDHLTQEAKKATEEQCGRVVKASLNAASRLSASLLLMGVVAVAAL